MQDIVANCPDCGGTLRWAAGSLDAERLEIMKNHWTGGGYSIHWLTHEAAMQASKGHAKDCIALKPRERINV